MTITSSGKLEMLTGLRRKTNELARQSAHTGKVTAVEFNQLCNVIYDLIGTLRQEEEAAQKLSESWAKEGTK